MPPEHGSAKRRRLLVRPRKTLTSTGNLNCYLPTLASCGAWGLILSFATSDASTLFRYSRVSKSFHSALRGVRLNCQLLPLSLGASACEKLLACANDVTWRGSLQKLRLADATISVGLDMNREDEQYQSVTSVLAQQLGRVQCLSLEVQDLRRVWEELKHASDCKEVSTLKLKILHWQNDVSRVRTGYKFSPSHYLVQELLGILGAQAATLRTLHYDACTTTAPVLASGMQAYRLAHEAVLVSLLRQGHLCWGNGVHTLRLAHMSRGFLSLEVQALANFFPALVDVSFSTYRHDLALKKTLLTAFPAVEKLRLFCYEYLGAGERKARRPACTLRSGAGKGAAAAEASLPTSLRELQLSVTFWYLDREITTMLDVLLPGVTGLQALGDWPIDAVATLVSTQTVLARLLFLEISLWEEIDFCLLREALLLLPALQTLCLTSRNSRGLLYVPKDLGSTTLKVLVLRGFVLAPQSLPLLQQDFPAIETVHWHCLHKTPAETALSLLATSDWCARLRTLWLDCTTPFSNAQVLSVLTAFTALETLICDWQPLLLAATKLPQTWHPVPSPKGCSTWKQGARTVRVWQEAPKLFLQQGCFPRCT